MPVKKIDPDTKGRFNYILCIDIIVLGCILVIAGRPDGLAITLSAVILAGGLLLYRGSMTVKSYMSGKSRTTQARSPTVERRFKPSAPAENTAIGGENKQSWLRESE